jgi:pimeloyl-ACP methyl ester carboxylesterase
MLNRNGPSEFYVTGSLKNWSIKGRLSGVHVPTMLLNGRHDEATDETVQPYFAEIPRIRWFTFADSSHMPNWEERELFMERVAKSVKGLCVNFMLNAPEFTGVFEGLAR